MARYYGWDEDQAEAARLRKRKRIDAHVDYIEKNGAVFIRYSPPIAQVPHEWQSYFFKDELAKLDFKDREHKQE